MPQDPLTVLLVNDHGEEVKLVTLSFRRFFPGCRVEVVYSLEEALQWTPRADWDLILVDERLTSERSTSIFPELKRLLPYTTLVLQTDRSDPSAAVNALQAGADFLLYKKSAAFLTELMLYTRGAVETRGLRVALERTQERHNRLVDTLGDVLYELDAQGRFVYVSPSVTTLLGYAPEELSGAPFSRVVPADQLEQVRHRFNDRRTGPRASRRVPIELVPKTGQPPRVLTELSAKGLYDPQRRYLGTLGLLRDISHRRQQEHRIAGLERQLHDKEQVVQAARRLSTLSTALQAPLAAILAQSQQLLNALQEARLDQQVEAVLRQATEAAQRGAELAETVREAAGRPQTLHDILDHALASTNPPLLDRAGIERRYAAELPPFTGDRETATEFFVILLSHAQRHVAAANPEHGLRLTTMPVDPTGAPVADFQQSLFAGTQATGVQVHIEEVSLEFPHEAQPVQEVGDLLRAYRLVQRLGGTLEFRLPPDGRLAMTVWLPVTFPPTDQEAPPLPQSTPRPPIPVEPAAPASPLLLPEPPFAPAPALPDRRQAPRASVHLPATLTIGNVSREGWVTSLSGGGATVEVDGVLPTLEDQPAYVVLKTAASVLELQATAHDRTTAPDGIPSSPSRLALRFMGLSPVEEQILLSFVEEARARTVALSLEALLSQPDEPADPSLPAAAAGDAPERREALRVRVALPAKVELREGEPASHRPLALLVNMSRGGAALQMKQAPGALGESLSLHFSAIGAPGHPPVHEPDAPEAVLSAHIVWTAPDHAVPSELRPAAAQPGRRVGLRFQRMLPFAEREINRVIAQHVGFATDLGHIAGRSGIVSARRECRNMRQQVIAITDDHARHQVSPATPVVVLVPGFGKTQADYVPLSFFLAANRLRVLRYDHTNHLGQSDGDALQTALRSMQADLAQVLEFTRSTWPTAPVTVLAEDVGARVALKALASTGSDALALLIDPVLDLQSALTAAFHRDVLSDHAKGVRRGIANLWGLNVNLDQFLADAREGGYGTLAESTDDVAALRLPAVFVTTPQPAEPARGQVEPSLRALAPAAKIEPVGAPLSMLAGPQDDRHSAAFETVYRVIAAGQELPTGELRRADQREIRHQERVDQERLRLRHHVSQSTRDALWIAHTGQWPEFNRLQEDAVLKDLLYRLLQPLQPGASVLDLGCGHGDLAGVLLSNVAYTRLRHSGPAPAVHYVGLGHAPDSLAAAERWVAALRRDLSGSASEALSGVDTQWLAYAWDDPLPFADASFDRVVSHLALCFSPSPLTAIRDALRVLTPTGTVLLTCFQPHTDFSSVYRRYLKAAGQDEFNAPGQIALHYLGRLREAIRHGILHRYGREELAALLFHAGASPVQIRPAFDGQLLVALARKGKSPG